MSNILVTYATRAGSTVEVAEQIASVLGQAGATVALRPVKEVHDLRGYSAVVIGSAIRMGSWLPEAVDFVKKNQARLREIPTAFFTVHMLNRDDSEKSREAREAYTHAVRQMVIPNVEAFFDGKMDYARISFLDRTIARAVAKSTNSQEGDYRDWDKIRDWAEELQTNLIPA
jgi:menaquinone-dependent protoporphyrinogen oxidase